MIIVTLMEILATIPKNLREQYNEALKTRNPALVRKAYFYMRRQMKSKYKVSLDKKVLVTFNFTVFKYTIIKQNVQTKCFRNRK